LSLSSAIKSNLAPHRLVRVRKRYFFTRNNKLRLRYIAGTVVIASLVATSLLGSVGTSIAFVPGRVEISKIQNVIESISGSTENNIQTVSLNAQQRVMPIEESVPSEVVKQAEALEAVISSQEPLKTILEPPAIQSSPEVSQDVEVASVDVLDYPRSEVLKMNMGDTVAGALQDMGIKGAEAYNVMKAMGKHYDPRSVKVGQAINVDLDRGEDGVEVVALTMKIDATKELVVNKDEQKRFKSAVKKKKVDLKLKAAKISIENSLYGSAAKRGVPASVVAEMIRIYSYEVDFQRDIRQGDQVEILYETYETEDGDFARYGDILYAKLVVGGDATPIYRFEDKDGSADYFQENGKNLKRTLMQTPIDGARVSSGFGMRRHPVLGYNKMHKGIDFAAARGTPILAAGDGTIEKAGRNGGDGNYIRIRHNGELQTAYAHMKKFAKNISVGKRVKQGQVIGYVGSTGRSTGPHLHFEVLKNGKQTNPKSIKSASSQKLSGRKLKEFRSQISNAKREFAKAAGDLKFANNVSSE